MAILTFCFIVNVCRLVENTVINAKSYLVYSSHSLLWGNFDFLRIMIRSYTSLLLESYALCSISTAIGTWNKNFVNLLPCYNLVLSFCLFCVRGEILRPQ